MGQLCREWNWTWLRQGGRERVPGGWDSVCKGGEWSSWAGQSTNRPGPGGDATGPHSKAETSVVPPAGTLLRARAGDGCFVAAPGHVGPARLRSWGSLGVSLASGGFLWPQGAFFGGGRTGNPSVPSAWQQRKQPALRIRTERSFVKHSRKTNV